MPRRPQGSIPLLELDPGSPVPLHRQLADEIRAAVLNGRLAPGARLPSTRSLADDLDLSRSTVVTAFEQLNTEGYLTSRSGSGTVVSELALPEGVGGADRGPGTPFGEGPPAGALPPVPFRPGIPALDAFASGAFARILRRTLRGADPTLLILGPVAGEPSLRVEVARHLRTSRKVRCSPEDVIITSGSQEGLALAASLVAEPGEQVWMEHPGYIGARRALESAGAVPVPVPVDGEGLRVAQGLSRWPDAVAAYLTPSHQFPTGGTLSLSRRLELLEWAQREGRWLMEDDYDSEFRLQGRPLPSLQGLDEGGRVLYVGTFSKSLAPALRLGFLVVPAELRSRALALKLARHGPAPAWLQRAAGTFLEEGHFARHIRRTRALYRRRREALVEAVEDVGEGLRLRRPTGAMHAVLDLPPGCDANEVARRARLEGVEVLPLSFFAIPPDPAPGPALLLGFAGYGTAALTRAARRLVEVVRDTPAGAG